MKSSKRIHTRKSRHKKRHSGRLVQIETSDETEKKLWSRYLFKKIIGKGGFSIVIALYEKSSGKIIAAKVVEKHKTSPNTLNLLKQEPIILKRMKHPNILKMIEFVESKKRLFMLIEYMKGGDLSRYIKRRRRVGQFFRESEAFVVMVRLLRALSYLHSKNIVHRDIKPGNILIGIPERLDTVKIADFGLSFKYRAKSKSKVQKCGTLSYMAPEMIHEYGEITPAADMWAAGILMAIMLNKGYHPFIVKGEPEYETKKKIINRQTKLDKLKCSTKAKDLLSKLLCSKNERIKAFEALNHPWIVDRKLLPQGEALKRLFQNEKRITKVMQILSFYAHCRKMSNPGYTKPRKKKRKTKKLSKLIANPPVRSSSYIPKSSYSKEKLSYEQRMSQIQGSQNNSSNRMKVQRTRTLVSKSPVVNQSFTEKLNINAQRSTGYTNPSSYQRERTSYYSNNGGLSGFKTILMDENENAMVDEEEEFNNPENDDIKFSRRGGKFGYKKSRTNDKVYSIKSNARKKVWSFKENMNSGKKGSLMRGSQFRVSTGLGSKSKSKESHKEKLSLNDGFNQDLRQKMTKSFLRNSGYNDRKKYSIKSDLYNKGSEFKPLRKSMGKPQHRRYRSKQPGTYNQWRVLDSPLAENANRRIISASLQSSRLTPRKRRGSRPGTGKETKVVNTSNISRNSTKHRAYATGLRFRPNDRSNRNTANYGGREKFINETKNHNRRLFKGFNNKRPDKNGKSIFRRKKLF